MRINSIHLHSLRNNEHFQYVSDVAKIIKEIAADTAAKIKPQTDAFVAAIADEDTVLTKIMKSVLTAKIAEADAVRDAVFRGLTDSVKSTRNHFLEAVREAAIRVWNTLDAYKNAAAMSNVEETSALYNLITDLQTKHAEDVITLNLPQWIQEVKKANKAVDDLLLSRDAEITERPTEDMKDVRRRTDDAYRVVVLVIEALSVMETGATADALNAVIAKLNTTIERYNNIIATRKGRAAAKKEDETENTTEE